MSEKVVDYDSPWKEALELFFPAFMALCFPEAHAGIDWSRGYEFLDKELQKVVRDAELGRRLVDKLVKVWRKDGAATRVLVHIEAQGEPDEKFQERMYIYNYRLFDRYHRPIVSLAVFGDDNPNWRPNRFEYTLWGCQVILQFPAVKLLDYRAPERWQELEASDNPFATIIMAYLEALATHRDMEKRYDLKLGLVRNLFRRGFSKQDIIEIFRIIDWMMSLPEELEAALSIEVHKWEEENKMAFIAPFEQLAMKKGSLQAKREDILDILVTRFVTIPESITGKIETIDDLTVLRTLHRAAVTATSLEEFRDNLPR